MPLPTSSSLLLIAAPCALRPADRPTTPQILARLRARCSPDHRRRTTCTLAPSSSSSRNDLVRRLACPASVRSGIRTRRKPTRSRLRILLTRDHRCRQRFAERHARREDDDSTAWSQMTAKEGHFAGAKDSLQLKNGHVRINGDGMSDVREPLLADNDDGKQPHVFGL